MELHRLVIEGLLLGGTEIEGSGVKQAGGGMIGVNDGADEILAVQLDVERNQCVVRSVDSLNFLPVVVNFAQFVAIAGLRVANYECLFDRQMSAGIDHQSDRFIL